MGGDAALLAITYVGHATVLVEIGGRRILTDPVLRASFGPIRRVCPVPRPEAIDRVDAVVISHLHADHFDQQSLARFVDELVVVPAGAREFARGAGLRGAVELQRGASLDVGGVNVEAFPAAHDGKRFPRGPTAEAVGYLLSAGGRSVYFAGDTALFDGMAALRSRVDVALLPVWGWGPHLRRGQHLTPRQAAEAVALIRPAFAIPIHWGTYWPRGLGWYRRGRLTAPAIDFRDHVEALGLPTTVVVLEPGRRWSLESHG